MTNLNSLLEKIIQVQTQTISKINSLSVNYQLPSSVVQLNQNNKIPIEYLNDYTAFEVFAHDYDIPSGYCEELGGYVTSALTKRMTHKFGIRSQEQPEKQNVIVDWGDGNITKLADQTISGGYYYISHTYKNNGKYIIKIFGNTYFAIAQGQAFAYLDVNDPNILCRAFDVDLPVASHLKNLSSFCINANHLINVNIPAAFNSSHINNLSCTFFGCRNLLKVTGLPSTNKYNFQYSGVFRECPNLQYTDLSMIHIGYGGWAWMFAGCNKLSINIEDIFYYPFYTKDQEININSIFLNCYNLSGVVPADKLWNNKDVKWLNTSKAFSGCSGLIDQIPSSWGGTASDDIIEKSVEQKLSLTNQNLSILEQKILELESKLN